MNEQLTLGIHLNDEATLDNFCWGNNLLIEQQIRCSLEQQGERFLYLWGSRASGKSHLLQGCCQAVGQGLASAIYLPLRELQVWGAAVLENIEQQPLIAIDDIDVIAGQPEWEEALFHLYNRIRQQDDTLLLISGQSPPMALPLALADLRSRLSWGLVMQLLELDDEQKTQTLCAIARQRGITLTPATARFLLHRSTRNLHHLKAILDRLDHESLKAKRKITLPFVKKTLEI
ncbi:MAG: DnaA regulatory inactivator Hda [Legionellaceae bacterium]|nr:DnaA regulatory inactivator Hda [Legionellaceae bacterium]